MESNLPNIGSQQYYPATSDNKINNLEKSNAASEAYEADESDTEGELLYALLSEGAVFTGATRTAFPADEPVNLYTKEEVKAMGAEDHALAVLLQDHNEDGKQEVGAHPTITQHIATYGFTRNINGQQIVTQPHQINVKAFTPHQLARINLIMANAFKSLEEAQKEEPPSLEGRNFSNLTGEKNLVDTKKIPDINTLQEEAIKKQQKRQELREQEAQKELDATRYKTKEILDKKAKNKQEFYTTRDEDRGKIKIENKNLDLKKENK